MFACTEPCTEYTGSINNIMFPYFKTNLKEDIGQNVLSILLDESTDIGVHKQLGVCIVYYSEIQKTIVSTFLNMIELEAGNAVSLFIGLKHILSVYSLDLQNIRGMGCDNGWAT